jgi:regulatory protein
VATEAVEAALNAVPDDDDERARSFALHRAARLGTTAPEAAYRRLQGALLRRGYPPAVAREAARFALGAVLGEAGDAAEEP